jgi:hypothetical protein
LFFLSVFLRLRQEAFKPSRIVYAHYFSSSTFEHLFFNHPEILDFKKKIDMAGYWGLFGWSFLRNKKKTRKNTESSGRL